MHTPLSVMLIDDDETDNFITHSIIETTGLTQKISTFTSGRKALQFLDSLALEESQIPDLIFLDLEMPIVSGAMFIHELEKIAPKLARDPKIIILSSFEKTKDTDKIVDSARVIRYLNKPLRPSDFSEIAKNFEAEKAKVA
jgi:response regulator RpfG family c-di-GMP phosphodiesterase